MTVRKDTRTCVGNAFKDGDDRQGNFSWTGDIQLSLANFMLINVRAVETAAIMVL